jgi:hypothetical protein
MFNFFLLHHKALLISAKTFTIMLSATKEWQQVAVAIHQTNSFMAVFVSFCALEKYIDEISPLKLNYEHVLCISSGSNINLMRKFNLFKKERKFGGNRKKLLKVLVKKPIGKENQFSFHLRGFSCGKLTIFLQSSRKKEQIESSSVSK